MATLDELLSQETKPAHPSELTTTDAQHLLEHAGGVYSSKTLDYTITIDTTALTEILERFEKALLGAEEALRQLGVAAEKAEEIKDDSTPFFGGHWNVVPGSLYVSDSTNMEWNHVGEVTSASIMLNGLPFSNGDTYSFPSAASLI